MGQDNRQSCIPKALASVPICHNLICVQLQSNKFKQLKWTLKFPTREYVQWQRKHMYKVSRNNNISVCLKSFPEHEVTLNSMKSFCMVIHFNMELVSNVSETACTSCIRGRCNEWHDCSQLSQDTTGALILSTALSTVFTQTVKSIFYRYKYRVIHLEATN
jgi:hypothetical protein